MSEENVELTALARAAVSAFNERDLPSFLSLLSRDAVLQEHPDFSPNPGTYRGWVEIANYWESFERVWNDLTVELEGLRCSDNTVVAFTRFGARGKTSDAPIETPVALVGTVEAGKFAHLDFHLDREKALEAAGLSE